MAFIAVSYGVIVFINLLLKYRNRNRETYTVTVHLGENGFKMRAFADSGNLLTEPFSGYPVLFFKSGVIPEKYQPELKLPVVCNTVAGDGLCYVFRPDFIDVEGESVSFKTDRVYICENPHILEKSTYDMILNCQVFREESLV